MLTVIKLGGSLLETERLRECLQTIQKRSGRIAIVTGGGVFAEQVRLQQQRWQFDDVAAHRMALLAMQQMAILCHGLIPAFSLFEQVVDFDGVAGIGIWLPQITELDVAGIPATWDITSDSLSAWLANRLGADRLELIKAAPVNEAADLSTLQAQGLLDEAFLRLADPSRYHIRVVSQQHFLAAS